MSFSPPDARTRRPAATVAATLAAALVALTLSAAPASPAAAADAPDSLTSLVNPFIGSKDDGNTYPGASMPFGMVQFSPDNGHNTGYNYDNSRIRGFSLVHLSGVGCGLGGLFPVLPTTGIPSSTRYEDYALSYSHDTEQAAPGYYRVDLQAPAGAVRAELSATAHTAVQRYTFPATSQATVLLNPGQALNRVTASSVHVIDARTVETAITSRGFCQDTQPFTVYTRTTFDRDIAAFGTWNGDSVSAGAAAADGERTGAYVTFDTTADRDVEAVTSLSYVDADGAAANASAEATSFDTARSAADAAWEQRLGSVRVPTTDENRARIFYSALYRTFLAPNTGTDVDGRYRGWDGKIHTADGFTYYQNYSLWDTYRTQQQLLALLAPHESRDMAISLVKQGQQFGWLPRWGYGPVETNVMTGDPGTAFLVSAWSQGLLRGYEEDAYQVLRNNADNIPPASSVANGRAGNPEYLAYGYVPNQPDENGQPGDYDLHHGGSATLEYALSDALLSTMAAGLGHTDDAARYAQRGENYRAVFDPTTGNFRPRDRSGFFVGDSDPAQTVGFHEGTALQYQWLAPQDVPGLIALLGGTDKTRQRLDDFFAYDRAVADPSGTAHNVWVNGTYSYYGQRTYNPNNEPDLHSPYIYQWVGQPWKTTDVVRAALTLFTDGPTGVTGNDDLGTMSAWYVLSAMGMYPIVPGSDVWGLSTPAFSSVDIALDPSWYGTDALHVRAPGLTDANRYVQSVTAENTAGRIDRSHLTGAELTKAGTITFGLGTSPSSWATGADAAPAALVTPGAVAPTLQARATPAHVAATAGGSATLSIDIMARAAGTAQGTISVTGSDVVASSAGSVPWRIDSAGLPVSQRIPVQLSVKPGIVAGAYPVTVQVADASGASVEVTTSVVIADSTWLTSTFDNTGIGDARAGNADFDGGGYYLLRDALAQQGYTQGAAGVVANTTLTFAAPATAPGSPDNVRANGQTLTVPDAYRQARSLSLVGAANNGDSGGTLTMTFTDGTTSQASAILSDWCTPNPAQGNVIVAKAGQRGDRTSNPQNIGCGLYATAPIAVPDGKTLASITLPTAPKMHVFTVAFDVPNPIAPTLTAEVAPSAPAPGAAVTITVRTTPADAVGELVLTRADGVDAAAASTLRATSDSDTEIARVPVADGAGVFQVTATTAGARYRVSFVPTDATRFAPSALGSDVIVKAVDPSDGGNTGGGDNGGGDNGGGSTGGNTGTSTGTGGTSPAPSTSATPAGTALAHTGGALAWALLPLGAAAIAVGSAVVIRRRRLSE